MNRTPVIFGEVLFDCFPDGSTVLGGAPFNVAWHLQALGCSPLLISRIGDDPLGRQICDAMSDWGMNTAGLQLDSQHPTGTVDIQLGNGDAQFDIRSGAAWDYIDTNALPPTSASALLYHGTLALRGARSRTTLERMRRDHRGPIFLDVNLRPPWWQQEDVLAQLHHADWVKLNDQELAALLPESVSPQDRARQLMQQHELRAVVVTRGKNGALAITRDVDGIEIRPAADIQIVDTVGAGDAFSSVLIAGVIGEWPLDEMLAKAQRLAAAVVGQRGATISAPDFYKPFRQE